jgi:hypothetical protein
MEPSDDLHADGQGSNFNRETSVGLGLVERSQNHLMLCCQQGFDGLQEQRDVLKISLFGCKDQAATEC